MNSTDYADFNARQDIVKRLTPEHADMFRAHHLSVPTHMVKDDLPGQALEAAFAALIEAHHRIDKQSREFRAKTEQQAKWRNEEIAKAREDDQRRNAADIVELASLRELSTVVRRAHRDGRKTLRVADLTAVLDNPRGTQ